MNEDEHFIIEDKAQTDLKAEENKTPKFPVRTQLLLLCACMFFLFAGVIIPKSITDLATKPNQVVAQASLESMVKNKDRLILPEITDMAIRAEAALVFDVVGQQILYQKNPERVLPLASITKLMTALVAYEILPDETPVTISITAEAQQSGGSLRAGEIFPVKKLADFALISSYNSAAYTLADSVGKLLGEGDAVEQFVAAMNIKAKEINLPSLNYRNPTGLDITATEAGAYGNALDTTLLLEYILKNYPEILTPTITKYTRLYNQKGEFHEAHNTNNILSDIPNLLGTKTGYTDLAGGNLAVVFDAGFNRPIIITVLGSSRNERFSDVKKLVATVQTLMLNQP
jgi:D-alanyl-D-alanine carboxypeptidase